MATPCAVVLVTVPDAKTAKALALELLRLRLAACVSEVPGVRSRYWWKGKVRQSKETLLVIKTQLALSGELTRRIKELHPYDTPEVLALPVEDGNADYLDWVAASTRPVEE